MLKKISVCVVVIIAVVGVFALFFRIPFSHTHSAFTKDTDRLRKEKNPSLTGVYSESDFSGLPLPVQRFFRYCGFIGKQKSSYMKIAYKDVSFITDVKNPPLIIDYTQYNFATAVPARFAYIRSSLYGIPFEGYDSYEGTSGRMKGCIAKVIPFFDENGPDMASAGLVTMLSEALFFPSFVLEQPVTWNVLSDTEVEATLTYGSLKVSGVFSFSPDGKMTSFTTQDRVRATFDGKKEYCPWSVRTDAYTMQNGLSLPTVLQAVWHTAGGDMVYFDARNAVFSYAE